MKHTRLLALFIGIVILAGVAAPSGWNTPSEYTSPEELVSFSATIPFDDAVGILSDLSKQFSGKVIVTKEKRPGSIGVEIRNMSWQSAFAKILQKKRLEFVEHRDYIEIVRPGGGAGVEEESPEANLDTREVNIRSLFFEVERTALKEAGFNWSALYQNEHMIKAEQIVTSAEEDNVFSLEFTGRLPEGIDVSGLLRALESRNVGEIIANPQITVISGCTGRIQVGQDFSIKTRDFAGNIMDEFFSTGVILEVIPTVLLEEEFEFIHLDIEVQRSSAVPSAVSTVVNKTESSTSAVLRDGETTVIAGLYLNEDTIVRRGIPFLCNLPWWVFGIRYLTGYDQHIMTQKELIILIQAKLVPNLRERFEMALERTAGEMLESERTAFEAFKTELTGREP